MRNNNNILSSILEDWLPSIMGGDPAHKVSLIQAIRALSSSEAQSDLLAHLKTQYGDRAALQHCDPEVLLFLSQWVQVLMNRPGFVMMPAVKEANWQWLFQALDVAVEDKAYAPALYLRASQYASGIPEVLGKDLEKSLTLLKAAADAGYAQAQHDYAQNCQRGVVGGMLPKNLALALEYYQQAADQNFGPAQEALAAHYFNQEKNYEKGFNLLTQSAENKHAAAAYQLSQLYAKGFQQGEFTVLPDAQKVTKYLKQAADGGHVQAQYDYAQANKNQFNPTEYIRYLTSAAAQGHPEAKVVIREVNPEQLCRVLVSQRKLIEKQQQRIQTLFQCLINLSGALENRLGDAFNLSALLPKGITILGSPSELISESDDEFEDARATLEMEERGELPALH